MAASFVSARRILLPLLLLLVRPHALSRVFTRPRPTNIAKSRTNYRHTPGWHPRHATPPLRGAKIEYLCEKCGARFPKTFGRCLRCGEWDTCREKRTEPPRRRGRAVSGVSGQVGVGWDRGVVELVGLGEAVENLRGAEERMVIGDKELDRVFGGGIVKGGITLLGGDPGIGKSTLALQLLKMIASTIATTRDRSKVVYICGEETVEQVAGRAARLIGVDPRSSPEGMARKKVPENCLLTRETEVNAICDLMASERPAFVIIDSIQTVYDGSLSHSPGSLVQVRECAAKIADTAKAYGVSAIIIGHVTKGGEVAGPRMLEHLVDTVLYLEGERLIQHRVLRAVKNRFGSTADVAILEMTESGLRGVSDPSALLTSGGEDFKSPREGTAMCVVMEGSRPLIAEIQALAEDAAYIPDKGVSVRRVALGVDYQRMSVILAVLSRRAKVKFSRMDCWVSVVGGLKLSDAPSVDLAMAVALSSSRTSRPISPSTCFCAEVGLGGELRALPQMDRRLREAARFGFSRCICAKGSPNSKSKQSRKVEGMEVISVCRIEEALRISLLPSPQAKDLKNKKSRSKGDLEEEYTGNGPDDVDLVDL